jgi:hypothetical protein
MGPAKFDVEVERGSFFMGSPETVARKFVQKSNELVLGKQKGNKTYQNHPKRLQAP